VYSRLADESLWAQVLNLGGFDVLMTPFEPAEVLRVTFAACRRWEYDFVVSTAREATHTRRPTVVKAAPAERNGCGEHGRWDAIIGGGSGSYERSVRTWLKHDSIIAAREQERFRRSGPYTTTTVHESEQASSQLENAWPGGQAPVLPAETIGAPAREATRLADNLGAQRSCPGRVGPRAKGWQ